MNKLRILNVLMIVIISFPTIASTPKSQLAQLESTPFQKGDIFASVSNGLVHRYNQNGTLLEILDTGKSSAYTTGCGFDSAGNLYVTTFNGGDVVKFKGPEVPHTNLGIFGSGYSGSPESIVFDSVGNVYVGAVDGDADIRKFDATGNQLGRFDVDIEDRGSDWMDLDSDQRMMYYTSEGKYIWRYDVVDNAQLSIFNFSTPLPGTHSYALRVLPDGGILVADTQVVVRLDSTANIIQTYDYPGENSWFSLNLDPDGVSFWAGNFDTGKIYKFNIETGGNPTFTIDTGVGAGRLFGICVFDEITSGLKDEDKDGIPDDWELNGVDTDGDGERDLFLNQLDEVGENLPPSPDHKDIYVWVDWFIETGDGAHQHTPDEVALLLVKEAYAEAPADAVDNPDEEMGINLHIVLGNAIEEPDDGRWDELGTIPADNLNTYLSPAFSEIKRRFLMDNGTKPGMASVFHYALYAHYISNEITVPCMGTGRPSGIAPFIRRNPDTFGSDFIIGHQTLVDLEARGALRPIAQGGTFMHELGHTLYLGHGGVGPNHTNFKPNHLSVMNYSFTKGLLFRQEGMALPIRSKLDYSIFGSDTIPNLDENTLNESGGLRGGDRLKDYGTIYYSGWDDDRGIVIFNANGNIDWDDDFNVPEPEAVKANINSDAKEVPILGCVDEFSDNFSTSNEWAGLVYKSGEIGKAAALVENYPTESAITIEIIDLAEEIFEVTDEVAYSVPSLPVLDDFNRANGLIGNSWLGNKSRYRISGNQLLVNYFGTTTDIYWKTAFGADQEAYVTLANINEIADEHSLLLKAQSNRTWGNGVLEVQYNPQEKTVQVWTWEWPGGWVKYGDDIPVTFVDGDTFGARARPDGIVEVYRNGELLGIRDVSSWKFFDKGGYIGLWFLGAKGAILDDFGGGTVMIGVVP